MQALLLAWFVVFLAWLIVLILWLRALVGYCQVCREYEKAHGEPYQSPCEANKLTRVTLKLLRRLGLLLRDPDRKD